MTDSEQINPAKTDHESSFAEVASLIRKARQQAFQTVNTTLIDLYRQVGEYISAKLVAAAWGEGVVDQLARYLARTQPGLRGFSRQNLFRMKLFYETYRDDEKVSPLVRQLPWTHNLIFLGQCKRSEEREFYLLSVCIGLCVCVGKTGVNPQQRSPEGAQYHSPGQRSGTRTIPTEGEP